MKQLPPLPAVIRSQPTTTSGLATDEDQAGQEINTEEGPRQDFIERNNQRLKEMQDSRHREKQLMEEEQTRKRKKQEKLRDKILKEAEEYKAQKAQREAERAL